MMMNYLREVGAILYFLRGINMDWFDILKISFKPHQRDRPAPNISISDKTGANAAYFTVDDSIEIFSNLDITPEELAQTLAHETTHQAQYMTNPELKVMFDKVTYHLFELLSQINDLPLEFLNNQEAMSMWQELQPDLEKQIRMYFELVFTIEMQAYDGEANFNEDSNRARLVKVMLGDLNSKIELMQNVLGMPDDKFKIASQLIARFLKPLIVRISKSYVLRERV